MLGLSPLLQTAASLLDQLCLARMQRPCAVLTPEYISPGIRFTPEGRLSQIEETLHGRLAQIACQLDAAGPAASAAAILAHLPSGRRQSALLGLASGGAWMACPARPDGTDLHRRTAADGQVYLLAGRVGKAATHAPHAMLRFEERLWILPATHPCADGSALPREAPDAVSDGSPDSLSLQAGLRDLAWALLQQGQDAMAHSLSQAATVPPHAPVAAIPALSSPAPVAA
jgi:hypothetical protein